MCVSVQQDNLLCTQFSVCPWQDTYEAPRQRANVAMMGALDALGRVFAPQVCFHLVFLTLCVGIFAHRKCVHMLKHS